MKILIRSTVLIGVILMACSCANTDKKQTPVQHLCSELKRNLVFDTASSPNVGTASATDRARTMQMYRKNNCAVFEKTMH